MVVPSHHERAIEHHYRRQGGDGLYHWADHLERIGETVEARRVFTLVLERDPQSLFANEARARLRGH